MTRLRCTVETMNYSACELALGDHVELDERGVRLAPDQGFCVFAIAALASAMAGRPDDQTLAEWADDEPLVACPDPPENLIMRVRRLPEGEHEDGA